MRGSLKMPQRGSSLCRCYQKRKRGEGALAEGTACWVRALRTEALIYKEQPLGRSSPSSRGEGLQWEGLPHLMEQHERGNSGVGCSGVGEGRVTLFVTRKGVEGVGQVLQEVVPRAKGLGLGPGPRQEARFSPGMRWTRDIHAQSPVLGKHSQPGLSGW